MSDAADALPVDTNGGPIVWASAWFETGSHDAIIGPTTIGVVEQGYSSTRDRLWAMVSADVTLDEILDELSSDGLSRLPSFALAQQDSGGLRVVARGRTCVVVTDVHGKVQIVDPSKVRTWLEAYYDNAAAVDVQMVDATSEDPDRSEADRYFVLAGVVPARRVGRDLSHTDALAARAVTEWRRPAPAMLSSAATPSELPPTPTSSMSEPSPEQPVESKPATGTLISSVPIAVSVPASIERGLSDDLSPLLPDELGASVRGAAPQPDHSEISEQVLTWLPIADETVARGTGGDDDLDSLTISRQDLARRSEKRDEPRALGLHEVMALVCPGGHANPPRLDRCSACGAALSRDTLQAVDRPTLAMLEFSNGETVVVDRSVLIGRNPKVEQTPSGELPRIVRFEAVGAGLSRTHAQLRVEGWDMLLEDLGSRNGTTVTMPGEPPKRLHPHEPVLVGIGAVIEFDDDLHGALRAPQ